MMLSTADLRSVGVTALGHQKAMISKIQAVTQKSAIPSSDGVAKGSVGKKGSNISVSEGVCVAVGGARVH
jgi:hypothetical protein